MNERRQRVGELHLGLEDIEAGNGAGVVAVLLVLYLLLKQRNVLFLSDDERTVKNDLVELVDDLRDDVVDGRAQAEERAVVGRGAAFDSIKGRSAVEYELSGLELNVPALVLNAAVAAAVNMMRVGLPPFGFGISPTVGPWLLPVVVSDLLVPVSRVESQFGNRL